MQDWQGAVIVGQGPRWAILHTATTQLPNGDWRYTYSFAPGRHCSYTIRPGPDTVSAHDPALIADVARIAAAYPPSA